jgi:hypothetical protein
MLDIRIISPLPPEVPLAYSRSRFLLWGMLSEHFDQQMMVMILVFY